MNYKNGRVVQINDRVVANHPSGQFIGTVSAIEGEHLRVHPMFSSSATYTPPADALRLDDALRGASEIPQIAVPSPASAAPAPAAEATPAPSASPTPAAPSAASAAPAKS